jgi:hypothetical protein
VSADVAITLAAAVVAMLVVVAAIAALPWLYDCRVQGQSIEIVLFRKVPIYRLRLTHVASVAKVTRRELAIKAAQGATLGLGNRPFGEFVLVTKRKGPFRRIVLTPPDAEAFVNEAKSQLPRADPD